MVKTRLTQSRWLVCLLGEEAEDEDGEHREEDDRLGAGHDHAGDLLIRECRETPDPRRLLVERVDRLGEQGEEEPDGARQEEGGEDVGGPARGRERMRRVLEDRPSEQEPREEVVRVLEME